MQLKSLTTYFDPFVASILLILALGILIPIDQSWITFLQQVGTWAVTTLFFVYGMRLPTKEVWQGLTNGRLQLSILAATFLVFPLLGLLFAKAFTPILGATFALGVLYLSLLPSTVQSSVSFTSIAGGNIAGAVCAATISNISGMFITPLLVWIFMGANTGISTDSVVDVLSKLLLPFVLGQLLQPFVGTWVRRAKYLTKAVDRGTILIVVAAGISGATARGLWSTVTGWQVLWLMVVSALLLFILLALTWAWGSHLALPYGDKVALLMCGSKKSLATGLPMAAIIFSPQVVAAVTIPVIVFHQIQLVVAAVLARRLAIHSVGEKESTW
ncbi:MAG: bile acid:sodium symporter family protein [Actinomycetaceae bacterium]|nr:bile acid:sodium symporter family protein [Actinomycetaceae bacterium]